MTTPVLSLLLDAGQDVAAAVDAVESTALVRDARDRSELVVATPRPTGRQQPWLRELVLDEPDPARRLDALLAAARGTWVAVVGAGDRLEPGALEAVGERLTTRPDLDVLYTDEQWPAAGSAGIFTKPRWSPEYERSLDYLGRLCAVRRELAVSVGGFADTDGSAPRAALEWDLHLRCVERTDRIAHLPVIALTRPGAPATDDATWDAGLAAVARHAARAGLDATTTRAAYPGGVVVERRGPQPLVSVVVPTGGGRRLIAGREELLVERCVRGLVERTDYPAWELVLATSQGTDPAVVDTVRRIAGDDRVVVVDVDGPFNFSRSVNHGVAAATGDLVLLLNDDVEPIEPGWLSRMVSVAGDPAVGAVGARLVLEDGRLQHVGIVANDDWVASHVLMFEPDGHTHFGLGVLDADFDAATGACLLLRRDVYAAVGGLDEDLPLNFNDVDLCFKVRRAGLRVVVTPLAHLHHYESSTRDAELRDDELAHMARYWRGLTWSDRWVNTRSVA